MKCPICQTRKPRRQCPGVQSDICSVCCGSEREVSIACPLDCAYLLESREHEKRVPLNLSTLPHSDIEITDRFLLDNRELTLMLGVCLHQAVIENPNCVDRDVREAVDALAFTYRSLANGLLYDSHLVNPYAAGVYQRFRTMIAEYRAAKKNGLPKLRDAEMLPVLVLYQRMAMDYDNGRLKGRAFISFLVTEFGKLGLPDQTVERPLSQLVEL